MIGTRQIYVDIENIVDRQWSCTRVIELISASK